MVTQQQSSSMRCRRELQLPDPESALTQPGPPGTIGRFNLPKPPAPPATAVFAAIERRPTARVSCPVTEPLPHTLEAKMTLLADCQLCQGLSETELRAVAEKAVVHLASSGEVVCRESEACEKLFVVVHGRVKLTHDEDLPGSPTALQLLGIRSSGEHFGETALLTGTPRLSTAVASMDTVLFAWDRGTVLEFLMRWPQWGVNLSHALGYRIHASARRTPVSTPGNTARRPRSHAVQVAALAYGSELGRSFIRRLATVLRENDTNVALLTATSETSADATSPTIQVKPGELRQALAESDFVLIEVAQEALAAEQAPLLGQCEELWWLLDRTCYDAETARLRQFRENVPEANCPIRLVWLLEAGEHLAPPIPAGLGLTPPDFKVVMQEGIGPGSIQQGLVRLVRHLHGKRVGLALGGGGARGLAHLGVVKALNEAGVTVDLMAGTSSGALTGLPIAAGWPPDMAIEEFTKALTPARLLRALPQGSYWYLWLMFRTGAWDRMLRRYCGQITLDQLLLPLHIVSADLVSGQQVVRSAGDAVSAVLESINFPPVGTPILRDGQALVDGGLLNNLPADVLPPLGADVVLAVDVVAQLRPEFVGNQPDTPQAAMRGAGMFRTLLRANEVQDHALAALRRHTIDVLIAPDTSSYEFSDFTQGFGLAEAGYLTGQKSVPQIREILRDLGIPG